jgi:hypothetical protein
MFTSESCSYPRLAFGRRAGSGEKGEKQNPDGMERCMLSAERTTAAKRDQVLS